MTRTRPSAALVCAILALVVAVCGTSAATYAASKVRGDSLIKKASLSADRIKPGTVTGTQVDESTLGTVPLASSATTAGRAATADRAGTADRATTAGTVERVSPGDLVRLTLEGNWVDAPFVHRANGFRQDAMGYVHLQGAVQRVAGSDTAIAHLPPAARPSANAYFAVLAGTSGDTGTVRVSPDGEVFYVAGDVYYLALDGISFYAG